MSVEGTSLYGGQGECFLKNVKTREALKCDFTHPLGNISFSKINFGIFRMFLKTFATPRPHLFSLDYPETKTDKVQSGSERHVFSLNITLYYLNTYISGDVAGSEN